TPGQLHGALSGILRRYRTVEQTLGLAIKVAQVVGLEPVRQNTKQQVARQARMRSTPEYVMPTVFKLPDVELAQARNLDVKWLSVRRCRTDLDARHGAQDPARVNFRGRGLPPTLLAIR